jgi:hypothetical protein
MDIIDPGRLGDLKAFSSTYRAGDLDALEKLRASLLDGSSETPPPVLRRMKVNHIDGLPEKKIHIRTRMMPPKQAQATVAPVHLF